MRRIVSDGFERLTAIHPVIVLQALDELLERQLTLVMDKLTPSNLA
jgi:hypothetical protein